MTERILCAALLFKDCIVPGYRHNNCYALIKYLNPDIPNSELPTRRQQGFLTSRGRFVSRTLGFIIANKANQIEFGSKAMTDGSTLISENLYDGDCITVSDRYKGTEHGD